MIWPGVVVAAIARSRTGVWEAALTIGYATMLSARIIMILGGVVYQILHHLSIHRDRYCYHIR